MPSRSDGSRLFREHLDGRTRTRQGSRRAAPSSRAPCKLRSPGQSHAGSGVGPRPFQRRLPWAGIRSPHAHHHRSMGRFPRSPGRRGARRDFQRGTDRRPSQLREDPIEFVSSFRLQTDSVNHVAGGGILPGQARGGGSRPPGRKPPVAHRAGHPSQFAAQAGGCRGSRQARALRTFPRGQGGEVPASVAPTSHGALAAIGTLRAQTRVEPGPSGFHRRGCGVFRLAAVVPPAGTQFEPPPGGDAFQSVRKPSGSMQPSFGFVLGGRAPPPRGSFQERGVLPWIQVAGDEVAVFRRRGNAPPAQSPGLGARPFHPDPRTVVPARRCPRRRCPGR